MRAAPELGATFFVCGRSVERYLDLLSAIVRAGHALGNHTVTHPQAMPGSEPFGHFDEPPEALRVRERSRDEQVERLRALLLPARWARHEFALHGYFGFVDRACLAWVAAGCPADDRNPLVDAALGALQGALGDRGR